MDKAAKQGAGVACALGGVIAIVRYQTIIATVIGVVLVGIGMWLILSD